MIALNVFPKDRTARYAQYGRRTSNIVVAIGALKCCATFIYVFQINNLNQLDSTLKEKLGAKSNLAERLLSKKLGRDQYVEQDEKLQKTIDSIKDQAVELADNLAY